MSVVALVFAGIALLFAVVPKLSGFTFLFAITAMVLAIIGIAQRQTGRWMATIALIVGILALPISTVVFWSNVLENADDPWHKVPGGREGL
ncbi:hypothetical protein D9V28_07745 [Mycetocola zhadangensis]|uniref:Uncharacterized protein n=1 Tax=Mycetocola zhadangensis TaxID=1164595 RepID=A0A3L7J0Y3_9MICO|nr:hypothetical protein D9V28_07745 [Mycetocola zhadangensis]